jgi:hypothetical protein
LSCPTQEFCQVGRFCSVSANSASRQSNRGTLREFVQAFCRANRQSETGPHQQH